MPKREMTTPTERRLRRHTKGPPTFEYTPEKEAPVEAPERPRSQYYQEYYQELDPALGERRV